MRHTDVTEVDVLLVSYLMHKKAVKAVWDSYAALHHSFTMQLVIWAKHPKYKQNLLVLSDNWKVGHSFKTLPWCIVRSLRFIWGGGLPVFNYVNVTSTSINSATDRCIQRSRGNSWWMCSNSCECCWTGSIHYSDITLANLQNWSIEHNSIRRLLTTATEGQITLWSNQQCPATAVAWDIVASTQWMWT